MNYNRKRHKTLEILSSKRIQFDSGQIEPNFILGVDFEDIKSLLNTDRDTCEIIFAPLYNNNEVEYTDIGVKGLFLTQKGLTSYSEKKYLKENNKIIISWLKNFVQIVIPVLALVVAVLSLTLKLRNFKIQSDKEIQKINTIISDQKNRIKSLEDKIEIHLNHKTNDSLPNQ